jgi:hypothetical protein
MLRRQQAEAVVAARTKIVQGAVGMVKMVVHALEADAEMKMEPQQRAALASNLMVVLCGESEVHPMINAGAT